MASIGPNSPSAAIEDATVGTEVWNDPTFVFASDNSRAVSGGLSTGEVSKYLKATGFGFTVPAGATIDGISVSIERQGDSCADNSIKIVKALTVTGTEQSAGATWVVGTDTVATFGGPTSLWGTTWTDTDINNSGFGVAVSAVGVAPGGSAARIDHISITVYYTVGAPPAGATILPDADNAVGSWETAPLFSKLNDGSDATIISAVT